MRRRDDGGADAATLAGWAVAGFVVGTAAGVLAWSWQLRNSRQFLFSRSPWRRYAALGYLRGQPSVETARLLRDYMAWEQEPALRRRAQRLLRRMELHLE